MQDIRVHVVDYGRASLYMRYRDPETGKQVARSTGMKLRHPGSPLAAELRDAERAAAKWEAELQEGRYVARSRMTWDDFRERFENERLAGQSDSYWASMQSALNRLETLGVQRVAQVDANLLSRFQAELRRAGLTEASIRSYLKHVRAALSWAKKIGVLQSVPELDLSKRSRSAVKMKGRPITTEEFERMLKACESVRPHDTAAWQRYLKGLWLSGLRLDESLSLAWDEGTMFAVDLAGKHPHFRILAEGQKSRRDELLPMTPDFAEWLLQTPECDRSGPVFPLDVHTDAVCRIVSRIGRKAGVVVDKAADKYATAHDLRRSFGTRWSRKVMPATLQRLMRHADIKTTMVFYVQQQADEIAAGLWKEHRRPEVPTSTETADAPSCEGTKSAAPDSSC